MKKLLFLLAVSISLTSYSQQILSTGTIDNLSLSAYSVCACGNLTVSFSYTSTGLVNDNQMFKVYGKVNNDYTTLIQFSSTAINLMDKAVVGFDTTYYYTWKVPCGILKGADKILYSVSLKDGKPSALLIKDCTVGIEEYELEEFKPIYYNLSGQMVEPKQGELLIKQVGNKRIKIIIQ